MPSTMCQESGSPRNNQASTAICMSMVLLMMLDSMAERVRRVWFHSVKARAVLTIASQRMMPQWVSVRRGIP